MNPSPDPVLDEGRDLMRSPVVKDMPFMAAILTFATARTAGHRLRGSGKRSSQREDRAVATRVQKALLAMDKLDIGTIQAAFRGMDVGS